MEKVVVTRHSALVEYLRGLGVVGDDVQVIPHASPEDVRGKVVIGVLPLHLACEAEEVWEVPLNLPQELRGKELTLEEVRRYAEPLRKYKVQRLE